MQGNNPLHDPQVRDGLGDAQVYASAAQQEDQAVSVDSYDVIVRQGSKVSGDKLNLILSRWKRSLRYGNDYFKLINQDAYYRSYDTYLQGVLRHPATAVRFAVLTSDPDIILGFSVCRGNILDYVHVQQAQRRQGIARSLVPSGIDTITHLTKTGLTIWGGKYSKWAFNPFA